MRGLSGAGDHQVHLWRHVDVDVDVTQRMAAGLHRQQHGQESGCQGLLTGAGCEVVQAGVQQTPRVAEPCPTNTSIPHHQQGHE